MNKTIKTLVLASALALFLLPLQASAKTPNEGYIYSMSGRTPASLNGYVYSDSIDGYQLSTGPFDTPEDLFVADDDTFYIVDSGNGRVIHMDRDKKVLLTFGDQEGPGKLITPKGIFVTKTGEIYVADTGNRRIVRYDSRGTFVREYQKPDSPILGKDFLYSPSKVTVDKRGYLFVVSEGASQGLLQISPEGRFEGFFGANHIDFSWQKLFVRLIATKDQRDQIASEKPPEFSNVFQDQEGFMFTTTFGIPDRQVKRLSTVGVDILNGSYKMIYGDYQLPTENNARAFSSFVDVTADQDGMFTALDNTTGRAYQYDSLMNLLFIFGGIGEQDGLFKSPSSIAETKDGTIYIADKSRNRIDRFKPTPFGIKVHEASRLYVDGKYQEAYPLWQDVLRMNANYNMAYIGIGRALLKSEHYAESMKYFKLAHDKYGYSEALAGYRKVFLREHFQGIALGVIVALVLIRIAIALYKRRKALSEARTSNKAAEGGLNG